MYIISNQVFIFFPLQSIHRIIQKLLLFEDVLEMMSGTFINQYKLLSEINLRTKIVFQHNNFDLLFVISILNLGRTPNYYTKIPIQSCRQLLSKRLLVFYRKATKLHNLPSKIIVSIEYFLTLQEDLK